MKHIKVEINEIDRMKYAIRNTKSICLKRDYKKKIDNIVEEIKEYCGYLGYDWLSIKEKYKL